VCELQFEVLYLRHSINVPFGYSINVNLYKFFPSAALRKLVIQNRVQAGLSGTGWSGKLY